jgi:CubicO group peptidase (beta-lactamase class C family)
MNKRRGIEERRGARRRLRRRHVEQSMAAQEYSSQVACLNRKSADPAISTTTNGMTGGRMKSWMRIAAALLGMSVLSAYSALGQSLSVAAPESVGMSSVKLDNIKKTLQAEVDKGHIPGAVVMINRKGKLVYSEAVGYQNKDANLPMKKDALFRIYSMTKPLAAVAAMILEEEGKIVLADPVSKYLPEFANVQVCNASKNTEGKTVCALVPAEKPITVQDLLRHTSGIGYGETTKNPVIRAAYIEAGVYVEGGTDYDQRRVLPKDEVTGLSKAPLSSQPGTNWEYGMSMDLMGRIIEAVSGQSLSQFMNERIFQPLQMTDSGFYVAPNKQARLAEPFKTDPFTNNPIKLIEITRAPNNDGAGSGAVSTAADYMNFASMLLNGGTLNGKRILSPMTVALMTSDQLGSRTTVPLSPGQLMLGVDGYTFGLGFMVRQGDGLASVQGSPGEFMWGGAAGTFFWVDPKEQLAVVLMSQVPGPIRPHYRRLIKEMVAAAVVN